MREIFEPFGEFMIVVFDNILVLAHDYSDAFEKLKKVITGQIQATYFIPPGNQM
jgi:hypothetical protein